MFNFYLIIAICIATVLAHPYGAPLDACDTMTPMHQFYQPQPSATPFQITVSSNTAAIGEDITVSIASSTGNTFQGFLVKALPVGVDLGVAGTFTNTNVEAHYLPCNNISQSAVTHSNSNNKTSIEVSWRVDVAGDYNFKATVVEYFDTFWVGFLSETITVQ